MLQLETEKRVLANSERLYTAAMSAHELLYEGESAAESTLGAALKHIEELARFDAVCGARAADGCGEGDGRRRRRGGAGVCRKHQCVAGRLEEIEDRLAALDRLKRKYGHTLADVIAFGEEASRKLAEVENRDALLVELKAKQDKMPRHTP